MNTDQIHGVRRAAELMGSQLALAKALKVTPVTVSQWMHPEAVKGRPVPPKQCVRIERLTSGQVSRRDLRPDDWVEIWPELVADAPPKAADADPTDDSGQPVLLLEHRHGRGV